LALEEEAFLTPGPVIVMTINLGAGGDEFPHERDAVALASAIEHASRRFGPREVVRIRRADHAALVIARPDPAKRTDFQAIGRDIRDRTAVESGRPAEDWWIGLGDVRPTVADAACSYHESRRAAAIARAVRSSDPVARFSQVGVFGLLSQIKPADLKNSLHPGLLVLRNAGESGELLIQTLTTYLDLAGDVKATASALSVHRTTLYYRLGRIEELANVDLNNGNDRLTLHLGLKIMQYVGR
jgi:sugar diacid utilization regulator